MTHDDALLRALKELDQPVDPSVAFADLLEAKMRAEAAASAQTPEAWPGDEHSTPLRLDRRRGERWMQIAAVAVLILTMIGGLSVVQPNHGPTPAATIRAPMSEQPAVMLGGTAAQDNQYPGPSPSSFSYALRYSLDSTSGGLTWPAYAFDGIVYGFGLDDNGAIEAVSAETGRTLWSHKATWNIQFAVTSQGVIVGVPARNSTPPSEPSGFQVALLDRVSGTEIWRSGQTYGHGTTWQRGVVIVDQGAIYFTNSVGAIFAVDLASGAELWRYEYDRSLGMGVEQKICVEATGTIPRQCTPRTAYPVLVAVKHGTLYFSDMQTARVTAISASDGAVRWSVSMVDRTRDKTYQEGLMAVDDGVVVALSEPGAVESGRGAYFGVWSEDTGAEIWARDDIAPNGMATDGTSLFVNQASPEAICCTIEKVSLKTGASIQKAFLPGGTVVWGYLPSGNSIIFLDAVPAEGDWGPVNWVKWMAVDAESLQQTWHFDLTESCLLSLPLTDTGDMVCNSSPPTNPASPPATFKIYAPNP